jgi:hypothetical protein
MGYRLRLKDKNRICATVEIGGEAAEVVKDKIDEVKNGFGVKKYGVNAAVQSLLCELYKLKKAKGQSPA